MVQHSTFHVIAEHDKWIIGMTGISRVTVRYFTAITWRITRLSRARAVYGTAGQTSDVCHFKVSLLFIFLYLIFSLYLSLVLFLNSLLCTDRSYESDSGNGCSSLVPSFEDLHSLPFRSFPFPSFSS